MIEIKSKTFYFLVFKLLIAAFVDAFMLMTVFMRNIRLMYPCLAKGGVHGSDVT